MKSDVKFILKQSEKFNKDGTASDAVKAIFEYYESHGFEQTSAKSTKYTKLHNLAHGKINKEDYIKESVPKELEFNYQDANLDDVGLNFYPIIPVFRNAILGEYDKKYIKYSSRAVNPENTNQVIERMDADLRDNLIRQAEKAFLAENPNPDEDQIEAFKNSEEIKRMYKLEYRTEIEKWAIHTMKKEDMKFDMKDIERGILDQCIITEDPVVHCNYHNGDYFPERWNEKDVFSLKSTDLDCYSESLMVGKFGALNIASILNKYADKLSEDQILHLETWLSKYYANGFTVNGMYDNLTGNRNQDKDSIQNWTTFKSLERGDRRYDDISQDLFRETTIYFLLPRKAGYLTYKSRGEEFKTIVDETFVPTFLPKYDGKKHLDTLIEGEHVEWFYYNELWRGIKLDIETSNENYSTSTPDGESIWIELQKHDIQYTDPKYRYGVLIPVYGGSISNRYNESQSLVSKCASWQIFYNWIWNRNAQLLATEVGRFFAFNQLAIPSESMGESWGKNNILKWALTGRDTSLAPLDLSMSNMGQNAMQMAGGIGQVVDLNRTADILEKSKLASIVKNECFQIIGMTPEYLFGDISPKQTATSVIQGMQRSSNQVQYLFTRLHQVLRRLRAGMLQTAQYIESQNPTSQVAYLTSDGTRHIFSTATEGFLLHQLDIFIESSLSDIDTLERIKQYTLQTNTLGADAYELSIIQTSTSTPELMGVLKKLHEEKKEELEKQQQLDMKKHEESLQAAREAQEKALQFEASENAKDRETELDKAGIVALGYANDEVDEIVAQIEKLRSQSEALKDKNREFEYKESLAKSKDAQTKAGIETSKERLLLDRQLKLKAAQQKDKELELREKEIIARNKRTKVL